MSFLRRTYSGARHLCAAGSAAVLVGCQSLSGAPAQPLVGVWQFVKETNVTRDGTAVTVPSLGYHGFLIYTANGYVSTTVMPDDRHWVGEAASVEELRASTVEGSTSGYSGRYTVDPRTHSVTHTVLASVEPLLEGQKLVRQYGFDKNELLLSGDWIYMGTPLRWTVHWARVQ